MASFCLFTFRGKRIGGVADCCLRRLFVGVECDTGPTDKLSGNDSLDSDIVTLKIYMREEKQYEMLHVHMHKSKTFVATNVVRKTNTLV